MPVFGVKTRKNSIKKVFSAVIFNISAYILQYGKQLIAAYMRLVEISNFFGRAKLRKQPQHVFIIAVVRLRVQFSVRKSTRPAFTELHVGILVQTSRSEEIFYCFTAVFHPFAALDYNGSKAPFNQPQRTKKTRRTTAYYGNRRSVFKPCRRLGYGFDFV